MRSVHRFFRLLVVPFLPIFLGTNVIFATMPESSLWSERRHASEMRRKKEGSFQLAGLLATVADAGVIGSFPGVQIAGFSSPPNAKASTTLPISLSASQVSFLHSLPLSAGTLRQVILPVGRKIEGMVLHIQDVHGNTDAQKNISDLVATLAAREDVGFIGLEGTDRSIDLQRFRSFPDRESVRLVADSLLREKLISGPIHAGFRGAVKMPPFVGVETMDLYHGNVNAYRDSVPHHAKIREVIQGFQVALTQRKADVYGRELRELDQSVMAYRNGGGFGDYLKALVTSDSKPIDPAIRFFLKIVEIEKHLNIPKIEEERIILLRRLAPALSSEQLNALEKDCIDVRLGRITSAGFYRNLSALCSTVGVPLSSFPAMDHYVRYVLLADDIVVEDLYQAVARTEKSAFSHLAKTAEERTLTSQDRFLYLMTQLLEFSLTPEQWAEYQGIKEKPLIFNLPEGNLLPFENFYRQADARDVAMADNLLSINNARRAKTKGEPIIPILVTGGFHSSGIARRLTKAGFVVARFVPRIEKIDTTEGASSLSLFSQGKTPLEQLFNGEKLFLAPEPIAKTIEDLEAPARIVTAGVLSGLSARVGMSRLAGDFVYKQLTKISQSFKQGEAFLHLQFARGSHYIVRGKSDPKSGMIFLTEAKKRAINPVDLLREQLYVLPAVGVTVIAFFLVGAHSPWAIPAALIGGMGGLMVTRQPFLDRHPAALSSNFGVSLSKYKEIVEQGYWVFGLGTLVSIILSLTSGSSDDSIQLIPAILSNGILSGMGFHAIFNLMSRVPAMGMNVHRDGTIDHLSVVVGKWRHYVIRDPEKKISAHVEVSAFPQREQKVVIELPAGQEAVSLPARSESPWAWNVLSLEPVRSDSGFHGVEIRLQAEGSSSVILDIHETLMLNVVSLRMSLFYGKDVKGEEKKFIDHIRNLSPEEKTSIEKLMSAPLEEVIVPRINRHFGVEGNLQQIEILKTTFDGRNHFRLVIDIPEEVKANLTPEGALRLDGQRSIEIRVRMEADVEPLTPVPFETLFTLRARRAMAEDSIFRESAVRFAVLAYENKLLAGSWMYPSYFGRDTLVAARLMWPALTLQAKKIVIQSVLNHLGGYATAGVPWMDGWVAVSDERQGELLFHETIIEFNRLMKTRQSTSAVSLLRRSLSGPRKQLEYHVLDANVLFTGLLANFLRDMEPTERHRFLSIQNNRGESNLDSVMAHANLLLALTQPYVRAFQSLREGHPTLSIEELKQLPEFHSLAQSLIRLQPDTKGQEFIGNWRDSAAALGWGKYPADVNAFLVPRALAALDEVFDFIGRGNPRGSAPMEERGWSFLQAALAERGVLGSARDAWSTARDHFWVHLSKDDVRRRLSRYLAWDGHSFEDRHRLGRRLLAPGISVQDFVSGDGDPAWLKGGFSFTAIALDKDCRPVPIVNSDEVFSIMEKNLSIADTRRLLDFWSHPYPVGLGTEAGPLISHPVLTEDEHLWRALDHYSYHGTVVWGWVTAALGLGWARQLKNAENSSDRKKILRIFGDFLDLRRVLGPMSLSEVWTWAFQKDGKMTPMDLVHGSERSKEGQPAVPIQLWSASAFPLDPLVQDAEALLRNGRNRERVGPVRDGVWQNLTKSETIPPRLLEKWRLLKEDARQYQRDRRARIPRHRKLLKDLTARGPPGGVRVAFLHYTAPPRVSGVDVVMTEQARWLARMGIQVRVVAGNRSNEFDSVPHLAFEAIEGLSHMEEGEIDQHLQRIFTDQDIVVLHNVMSVPNNLALTSALYRYIASHTEKHFIIFVHNAMEREEPSPPYNLMNPTIDWPQVTYVTVSKAYREVLYQSYPRAPPFAVVNPALWPYNPESLSSEAANDFAQNDLLKQDLVMVLPTRVDWNKDIPKALQITEAVGRRRPKTKLILLVPGVSSFDDFGKETLAKRGQAAAEWLEKNLRHFVEEYVVFLDATKIEGFREHRQYVADVVALSDLLLMPSRMESFGMPAIEAAAVRTVVAASDL